MAAKLYRSMTTNALSFLLNNDLIFSLYSFFTHLLASIAGVTCIYYLWQRIHTRLSCGSPCIKMFIYTAALQVSQPNQLYTRLPGVNIKLLFSRQPFQSQFKYIYTAVVCPHKFAIYTAAIQEPNRPYTLLSGV